MVKTRKEGIGLALSGGGFRATLFHLGSLWRLNELGYLKKMSRISSVSGGSILSAYLGFKWKRLQFNVHGVATNFAEEIELPIRSFCSKTIDIPTALTGWLNPFSNPGNKLTKTYDDRLFKGAKLKDLPDPGEGPEFLIYATSLNTGVSVQLKKQGIWDYKIGEYPEPVVTLAKAVAASSGFPPVFTPVIIKTDKHKWRKGKYATHFENKAFREKLVLTDGGVYDNLATEVVWNDFTTVLVSDAGAPLEAAKGSFLLRHSNIKKMLRVLEITMEQSRSLRTRGLINFFKNKLCNGTYWGIGTDIDRYELENAMVRSNKLTQSLKNVRTRLNSFSNEEQGHLINWGYALTDTAMRKHVITNGVNPGKWPDGEYKLTG